MYKLREKYSLMLWVATLVLIGSMIGSLTKAEINTWYSTLQRSALTPPSYVFGIAWTMLYTMIASCGWMLWRRQATNVIFIKKLYVAQLILNWSWTPLFFSYHLLGWALVCLLVMDLLVALIIYLSYNRVKAVAILMVPYLLWLLFATYLNFYIWQHN